MANSSTVAAGDLATATQYNDLRKDVLDTSTGHTHSGTDSATLATLGTASGHNHDGSNSRYAALSGTVDKLGANVTLTNANTYYSVLSRVLAAGTYIVYAQCAANGSVQLRLYNGVSTYYAHSSSYGAGGAGAAIVGSLVTLASQGTVVLAAAAASTGGTVLKQLAANGDSSDDATQLVCVRIA